MKRKNLSAMLAGMMVLCMLLTLFSPITMAAEATTTISNRTELENIKDNPSGNYRLDADIDLAGEKWEPLAAFSGTLDGNGHKIRNLSITDTIRNNKGLFASIESGGRVCNLGIEGVSITAGNFSGSIAGKNSGTISRCYATGTVSGKANVGGLVGENAGTIENCYSRVSVSGTDYLGGLAGSNSGSITKCYAASSVTDPVMNNYLQFKVAGYNGYSYTSGSYVNIPNNGNYKTDAFTLEAWFQVDSTGLAFIISKSGAKVTDTEWFEIHTNGNGLRFIPIPNANIYTDPYAYSGDSWIDIKDVLQEGWFHVAAVYSYNEAEQTASVQVYVNGEAQDLWQKPSVAGDAVNTGKTAKIKRSTNPLADEKNNFDINIGRRGDTSCYFNGKIADVRFWNTARTAEQIKANKDKVLTGSEDGLVGYWKLNESSGATATDISSTGNNGKIYGEVEHITASGSATNKGALVGSGTVTNCFYDSDLYGPNAGGAGAAKQTADMKTQSTYAGWDFDATWEMGVDGYPYLLFKEVNVTVSPAMPSVVKGGSQVFTATVTGTSNPAQTVNWTVEGGIPGTTIDTNGNLTVAAGETATTLTVKATSTVDTTKSGTATVMVTTTPAASGVTEYRIIEGENSKWAKGATVGLGFTANVDYGKFTGVSVDGVNISSDNYTSRSGSTIVELKPAFLKTLSAGQHTLKVSFTDGYAQTYFTVRSIENPKTGDSSQTALCGGIMIMAGTGIVASLVLGRKKRQMHNSETGKHTDRLCE